MDNCCDSRELYNNNRSLGGLDGTIDNVDAELEIWRSFGKLYAVKDDNTLYSLRDDLLSNSGNFNILNTPIAYWHYGIPRLGRLFPQFAGNNWKDIISPSDTLRDNNGYLWGSYNSEVQHAGLKNNPITIPYKDTRTYSLNNGTITGSITSLSEYQSGCYIKATYSATVNGSPYIINTGDEIQATGFGRTKCRKLDNNNFIIEDSYYNIKNNLSNFLGPFSVIKINHNNILKSQFPGNYSDCPYNGYNIRARLDTTIKKYLYKSDSNGNRLINKLKFRRKPSLIIKCKDIHPLDTFYFHKNGSQEEILDVNWSGSIDWLKITNPGYGYTEPPSVIFIPTSGETVPPAKSGGPLAITKINKEGQLIDIQMVQNPKIWKKPPIILFETKTNYAPEDIVLYNIKNINKCETTGTAATSYSSYDEISQLRDNPLAYIINNGELEPYFSAFTVRENAAIGSGIVIISGVESINTADNNGQKAGITHYIPANSSILSTSDPDYGLSKYKTLSSGVFTFSLVAGEGSDYNYLFNIEQTNDCAILRVNNKIDYERYGSGYYGSSGRKNLPIRIRCSNSGTDKTPPLSVEKIFLFNIVDINEPPIALFLSNIISSLPENINTSNPIKLADLVIIDDNEQTVTPSNNNVFTITSSNADASNFEIVGTGNNRSLYLKANTVLNYETQSLYSITINATDLGRTVSEHYFLNIIDTNDIVSGISLANVINSLPENTPNINKIKLADIIITDDLLGNNRIWISGEDDELFEIDNYKLYFKASTEPFDYDQRLDAWGTLFTKSQYNININVNDISVEPTGSPTLSVPYTLSITNILDPLSINNEENTRYSILNNDYILLNNNSPVFKSATVSCEIIGSISGDIIVKTSGNGYTQSPEHYLYVVARPQDDDRLLYHNIGNSAIDPIIVAPTPTSSITPTISITPSKTATQTRTPTITPSNTFTCTPSPTVTKTITHSVTNTITSTPTVTATPTLTISPTPTTTISPSPTNTKTPTNSNSPSPSLTTSIDIIKSTANNILNVPLTPTATPTKNSTISPAASATPTPTPTLSNSPTRTHLATPTFSPTFTCTPSFSQTVSLSNSPTNTPSWTPSYSVTPSNTRTPNASYTITPTVSITNSITPTTTVTPSPTLNICRYEEYHIADVELNPSSLTIEMTNAIYSSGMHDRLRLFHNQDNTITMDLISPTAPPGSSGGTPYYHYYNHLFHILAPQCDNYIYELTSLGYKLTNNFNTWPSGTVELSLNLYGPGTTVTSIPSNSGDTIISSAAFEHNLFDIIGTHRYNNSVSTDQSKVIISQYNGIAGSASEIINLDNIACEQKTILFADDSPTLGIHADIRPIIFGLNCSYDISAFPVSPSFTIDPKFIGPFIKATGVPISSSWSTGAGNSIYANQVQSAYFGIKGPMFIDAETVTIEGEKVLACTGASQNTFLLFTEPDEETTITIEADVINGPIEKVSQSLTLKADASKNITVISEDRVMYIDPRIVFREYQGIPPKLTITDAFPENSPTSKSLTESTYNPSISGYIRASCDGDLSAGGVVFFPYDSFNEQTTQISNKTFYTHIVETTKNCAINSFYMSSVKNKHYNKIIKMIDFVPTGPGGNFSNSYNLIIADSGNGYDPILGNQPSGWWPAKIIDQEITCTVQFEDGSSKKVLINLLDNINSGYKIETETNTENEVSPINWDVYKSITHTSIAPPWLNVYSTGTVSLSDALEDRKNLYNNYKMPLIHFKDNNTLTYPWSPSGASITLDYDRTIQFDAVASGYSIGPTTSLQYSGSVWHSPPRNKYIFKPTIDGNRKSKAESAKIYFIANSGIRGACFDAVISNGIQDFTVISSFNEIANPSIYSMEPSGILAAEGDLEPISFTNEDTFNNIVTGPATLTETFFGESLWLSDAGNIYSWRNPSSTEKIFSKIENAVTLDGDAFTSSDTPGPYYVSPPDLPNGLKPSIRPGKIGPMHVGNCGVIGERQPDGTMTWNTGGDTLSRTSLVWNSLGQPINNALSLPDVVIPEGILSICDDTGASVTYYRPYCIPGYGYVTVPNAIPLVPRKKLNKDNQNLKPFDLVPNSISLEDVFNKQYCNIISSSSTKLYLSDLTLKMIGGDISIKSNMFDESNRETVETYPYLQSSNPFGRFSKGIGGWYRSADCCDIKGISGCFEDVGLVFNSVDCLTGEPVKQVRFIPTCKYDTKLNIYTIKNIDDNIIEYRPRSYINTKLLENYEIVTGFEVEPFKGNKYLNKNDQKIKIVVPYTFSISNLSINDPTLYGILPDWSGYYTDGVYHQPSFQVQGGAGNIGFIPGSGYYNILYPTSDINGPYPIIYNYVGIQKTNNCGVTTFKTMLSDKLYVGTDDKLYYYAT